MGTKHAHEQPTPADSHGDVRQSADGAEAPSAAAGDAAQDNQNHDPRNEPGYQEPSPERIKGPNPEYSRNDYEGPDRGVPNEPPPPNVQKARAAKRKQSS